MRPKKFFQGGDVGVKTKNIGLQPVSKPVEQGFLGFKTVRERGAKKCLKSAKAAQ